MVIRVSSHRSLGPAHNESWPPPARQMAVLVMALALVLALVLLVALRLVLQRVSPATDPRGCFVT
jgi:hypothetical protein